VANGSYRSCLWWELVARFCGTFRWLWPASARGQGRKDGHQSCGFCPINLADPAQSLSGYEDAKSPYADNTTGKRKQKYT
jgi:hypothetical protein